MCMCGVTAGLRGTELVMSERVPALDAAPTVDAPSHRTPPAIAAASVGFAPRPST